jgi:hypothetical protein
LGTATLDLRVFATQKKKVGLEVVGTAALRLKDLRDVLALLTEQLEFQDLLDAQIAARKARKAKRAIA